jgi:hypothetical protein
MTTKKHSSYDDEVASMEVFRRDIHEELYAKVTGSIVLERQLRIMSDI